VTPLAEAAHERDTCGFPETQVATGTASAYGLYAGEFELYPAAKATGTTLSDIFPIIMLGENTERRSAPSATAPKKVLFL
jgi:hypothetical protein